VLEPHPLLELAAFEARFPRPLGALAVPEWLAALRSLEAEAPFARDEAVRAAVRDLLRHGGYKPTGRGKPASEYLVRAAGEGSLGSINLAVDLCNAVSLASGLPISVVDLERAVPPLAVRLGRAGERYAFNASGQEIDVAGLVLLADREGPCANAVKDAQRTKTGPDTRRVLCLVWGTSALPGLAERVAGWYRELTARAGAELRPVAG
jgi:DNA/RNA-binding domain of Phe-tRNA-synthetase-like protein